MLVAEALAELSCREESVKFDWDLGLQLKQQLLQIRVCVTYYLNWLILPYFPP